MPKYSDQDLIDCLQNYYKLHGKPPSYDSKTSLGIGTMTFVRRFGSWNRALVAANVKPNQFQSSQHNMCAYCDQSPIMHGGARCDECYVTYQRGKEQQYRKQLLARNDLILFKRRLRNRLNTAKQRANDQGVPFALEMQDLIDIWNNQLGLCYYTQIPLSFNTKGVARNTMSVDRLIPEKGYVATNVVFASYFANTSKGQLSESDFYDFCQLILTIRNKRLDENESLLNRTGANSPY